jgi:hypothetical protein
VLVVSPQPITSSSLPLQCIECVEQVRVSVREVAALHTGYLLDNVMVTDAEIDAFLAKYFTCLNASTCNSM